MKTFVLLLFFLPACYISCAQQNLLDKKSKIKKRIEKYYLETQRKYTVTETEKTLTYTLNDSITLPATYVYYFNKQNRCEKEETIYSCDSCMQKGVQQSLSNRFINWKKTGVNIYYAGFPYHALMEQVNDKGKYILRFTGIMRKELKSDTGE